MKVTRISSLLVLLFSLLMSTTSVMADPLPGFGGAHVVTGPDDNNSHAGVQFKAGDLSVQAPGANFPNYGKHFLYAEQIWNYKLADNVDPTPDNTIFVTDTRGGDSDGWTLSASVSNFTDGDQTQAISSLVFNSAKVVSQSVASDGSSHLNVNDSNSVQQLASDQTSIKPGDAGSSADVLKATGTSGIGTWGLFLQHSQLVTPSMSGQISGNFTATLTWNLNAGDPTNV
ncbi:WxL domain-containing protein [Bombilactobacillus folatiphilus]|uniref:WxL domain-containing protein n=1 Tax=Bombilactobacillus folatiphilus TaxID=2923362 RepID=A0ABY4P8I7_9LACO|nr:WxL domain-containing protein [Bombilactobacillus folatiphilus]UQS81846.1 WxL domain-containing protein [Bombilactobacillus folatiphilus]